MGSVKDLNIIERPESGSTGHAVFSFSDRYSVFDWGAMPEDIDRKGEVLALMGAYTFEKFEEKGLNTHYMGLEEDGEIKSLSDLDEPSSKMHIKLVNVIKPEFKDGSYDYSSFKTPDFDNYLIPLEIIYRNSIPIGSSARRRYEPEDLGLEMNEWPDSVVSLENPIFESSTKLEEKDRYLDDDDADEIIGDISLQEIYTIAEKSNEIITDIAEKSGMSHDDGKLEFLFSDGDILIGDVAGTFDEARFTYNETQVSKEVLRQGYKEEQSDWVEEVEEAKKEADEKGLKNWKELVESDPLPLGIEDLVSEMYQAGANRYIGKDFFEVRDLDQVMKDLEKYFQIRS